MADFSGKDMLAEYEVIDEQTVHQSNANRNSEHIKGKDD